MAKQLWRSQLGDPWAGQHPCNLQHSSELRVKRLQLRPQLQLWRHLFQPLLLLLLLLSKTLLLPYRSALVSRCCRQLLR